MNLFNDMTDLITFTEKCLVCGKSHSNEDEFIQCVEDNIDNLNEIDWNYISQHQTLSERFIERFHDKVDWGWISIEQKLSENFIERFQNSIRWKVISGFQQLSEEFIKKYQNKVDWWRISRYQNLSESFIEEVLVKLNDLQIPSESHIRKYVEEIKYDIEIAIKRNVYQQQYKKHIITILQEDKIYLTEEFKNELLTIILSEM
jgi:hypothetical protein